MTARSRSGTSEPEQTANVRGAYGAAIGPPPEPTVRDRRVQALRSALRRVRTLLAQAVWLLCLLAALALVAGAVLVVVDANTSNPLVAFVLRAADWADLGAFSRTDGVKQFTGEHADSWNAAVNWGLGAIAWLVVGRV